MIQIIKNSILLLGVICLITIESCKCDKNNTNSCPECGTNEVCSNGLCDCKDGYSKYYGNCIEKSTTNTHGYNIYISKGNCYTFDSTYIKIGKGFSDGLDSINSIVNGNFITITKIGYKEVEFSIDPNQKSMQLQNVTSYFENGKYKIYFKCGGFEGFPTFYPLSGINYNFNIVSTKWYGVFSNDKKTIDFKVVLWCDMDLNGYPETRKDSCNMKYEMF